MKNKVLDLLPFLLVGDLILPFLLAPTYRGYNHLTQVMSALGNSKAPLHILYNIWLIVLGVIFALFVMADKPEYQGSIIALEGLWQRLSLLCMYLPVITLCISKNHYFFEI